MHVLADGWVWWSLAGGLCVGRYRGVTHNGSCAGGPRAIRRTFFSLMWGGDRPSRPAVEGVELATQVAKVDHR
jgi:hypothetical protein